MKRTAEKRISITGDSKASSRNALKLLNSILELSVQRQVTENQIAIILYALAGARDPALIVRFPAVLAICARRGIELHSQNLLGRYWESSPKRQNLEKLLLISAELFRREDIAAPLNLVKIAESLKSRHGDLLSRDYLQLSNAPRVYLADMQGVLQQFAGDLKKTPGLPEAKPRLLLSARAGDFLDRLFSEKQKELVFKKLKGQHLSKTEREYYSRVVKKKLVAIADTEIQEIALSLCSSGRSVSQDALWRRRGSCLAKEPAGG
jgi:hypothetical protein